MEDGNIRVISRFRPLNDMELTRSQGLCISFLSEKTVKMLSQSESDQQFTFDRVFPPECSQEEVYETAAKPIVEAVMQGFNGTVFAYGQTSSGKTFTMTGPDVDDPELMGIIPRMVTTVFDMIHSSPDYIEYSVKVAYCEIYLEKIKDLLDTTRMNLKVHEDKSKGVYIDGLSEHYVSLENDVYDLMKEGSDNREVAYTNMNSGSSRSHSLFLIVITQTNSRDCSGKIGKLYLVDLAGSEKVGKTGAAGMRLEEAKNINKSLTVLGQVINSLTDGKSTHIPYRDSKLTRVLQDSLGGNSKTSLIVTCSPSPYNEAETLSSLRFGIRAKAIKNKPKVNKEYTVSELKLLLSKAQEELEKRNKRIEKLEGIIKNSGEALQDDSFSLQSGERLDFGDFSEEIEHLKNRLSEEVEINRLLKESNDKINKESKASQLEIAKLKLKLERITQEYAQSEAAKQDQDNLIEKLVITKENLENNLENIMRTKLSMDQLLSEKETVISQLKQELLMGSDIKARPKSVAVLPNSYQIEALKEENSLKTNKINELETMIDEILSTKDANSAQNQEIYVKNLVQRESEKWQRERADIMKDLENRIRRVIELEMQIDAAKDSYRFLERHLGKNEKEMIKKNQGLETYIGKISMDFQRESMLREKYKVESEYLQKKLIEEVKKNDVMKKEIDRFIEEREKFEMKYKLLEDDMFNMSQSSSRARTSVYHIKKSIKGGNNPPRPSIGRQSDL